MAFEEGISVRTFGGQQVAAICKNLHNRQQIAEALAELEAEVPAELVTGPPFWVRHFIHSYPEGLEVEVCLPVREPYNGGEVSTREFPEVQVLSKTSAGTHEPLAEIYPALFGAAEAHSLISDEFCMEVLHDHDPQGGRIEVLLVLHPWQKLFDRHLGEVMGDVVREAVLEDGDTIHLESTPAERFAWTKAAVDRLDRVSDDFQRYQVLSGCSHVFPQRQTEKLRDVYQQARADGAEMLAAVDVVLAFMDTDPGWRQQSSREGRVVYATKNPSNPDAYAKATTDQERRRAYCFCPIVQAHLEEGMSPSFCYCSAGFERKQWEMALSQPVRISVVRSLLKGDDYCQFAIHLPEE